MVEVRGQDLDRHGAIESRVARFVDLAHPARAERRLDGVQDREQALTDINEVEKGVFYTLSLTRNDPRQRGEILSANL